MLPSLRSIAATFLAGFVLAAAGVHLTGVNLAGLTRNTNASGPPRLENGEIKPAASGTIDWRGNAPVPALFDLRFSADLTAIAAMPGKPRGAAAEPAPEEMPAQPEAEIIPLPTGDPQ